MKTFSALLAICAGNSPVPGEFPTQRPVTRSFDVYFDLCLNKRLSKQPWGWWFETLSWSLWRHRNVHAQLATHSLNPCMIVPMQKRITHPKTDKMCIMIQSWIHSDPRYNQYFLIIIYFLFRIRPIWNSHLLYSLINLLGQVLLMCIWEFNIHSLR